MPTFSVRLEPLGRTILVEAGRPILEAALGAGINLPHSCKSGHCSSCRALLRAGEIAYPRDQRPAGLTEAEAAAGRVLLCQARARSDLVVEARTVFRAGSGVAASGREEIEIRRLPCRIDEKRLLAPDVLQLWLRLPAVEPLPFRAGQYLDILLEGGRRRSFSIASPPHDAARLELHVRRAPGSGFTAALFDAMPVGTLLRIEGPIGQFVYEPSDAPLLLVAGGTGFAPLKSILRQVLEVERAARPLRLYWGVRTPADAYEAALLREWCARHPPLRCTIVTSEPGTAGAAPRDEATLQWRAGWVHEVAAVELGAALAAHDVYVAGPPALVEAVRAAYPARGVAPERIRFDSFDYAPR
ncbi:MAG: FAD-binding oxidoreductase [Steroidobacteraceae bacterium]|jgi:CDP-4-dehydro-6-deoxyglucose reductase|nr:FAD-binding oxidoreductase [Steroidobacteraceae bacterium]